MEPSPGLRAHAIGGCGDSQQDWPHRRPLNPATVGAGGCDAQLGDEIMRVWKDNYEVYGAFRIWPELNRQGIRGARYTVERLMRQLGIAGVRRGKKVRTTVADGRHERAADLLHRDFSARPRTGAG
ncbi:IS3 family transposase [Micromonospora sp. DR5-3]|uniref:IS3 family transposase n=1 Tax=Micromonospora sp. DR5-3 TaxID=2992129 RepID=UPI00210714BF|nr:MULTISPECIES: IS3 family transposase [unclassified Micromonospora]MCW3816207.1 IS3 family transposase [Micromonospora sp. DR5-3]